jgi:hypothetical protein
MWTQIVGKVRLALCPPINHCWGVALYVTLRGLTTSPMPYQDGSFEIASRAAKPLPSGRGIRPFKAESFVARRIA